MDAERPTIRKRLVGRGTLVACTAAIVLGAVSIGLVLFGPGDGTRVTNRYALNDVSCATQRFCLAVASDGRAFTYSGGHWSGPQIADPYSSVNQEGQRYRNNLATVSCPTISFCMAVDDSSYTVRYLDGHWSGGPEIGAEPNYLGISVSCAAPSFCMAVDAAGHALTYSRGAWSPPYKLPYVSALTSVSCPTSQFCAAVASNGNAFIIAHGSWSVETIDTNSGVQYDSQGGLHHMNELTSVSCPTSQFCMAVGNAGYADVYARGSWSAGYVIDTHAVPNTKGTATANLTSVSCPTISFCMAVDQLGYAFTYDQGHWGAGQHVDSHADDYGAVGLAAVSCPTPASCAAVDPAGYGYTFSNQVPGPSRRASRRATRGIGKQTVSRDAQRVRQVIASLASERTQALGDARHLQVDLQSVGTDLAEANRDLQRTLFVVGKGQATGPNGAACPEVAGLSAYVLGNGGASGQAKLLEADARSGVDGDLEAISSSLLTLQADFAALEKAEATHPRALPPAGSLPDQSEVSQAVSQTNAASLQATSIADGFINQANSDAQAAYQDFVQANQAGNCGGSFTPGIHAPSPQPPAGAGQAPKLRGHFPPPM